CGAGYYCELGSINATGHDGYSGNYDHKCAAGYYCPLGSSVATEIICPTGSFCLEKSGAPTVCPANSYCVVEGRSEVECNPGYDLNIDGGGARTCDVRNGPCSVPNGNGARNPVTGICENVSCDTGYHASSDTLSCIPDKYCPRGEGWNGVACDACAEPDALDYKQVDNGACVISSCKTGFHLEGNISQCLSNVKSCEVQNGTGEQIWTSKSWGACAVKDCDPGYHIEGNMCLDDILPCAIANGEGKKEWIGTATLGYWGACEATLCYAGYTSDHTLTNDWTTQCGRCNNYYGYDGLQAVGSYSSECNIAVCMYQGEKYVLENDECVPICEDNSDESGAMQFDSVTNKCQRTCETGYISW
ncbi:MAG: hypothetical protein LBL21_02915, partial [Rickettsiales bacterium]|nr:hypothetical protein [Rickettsiales bacterium]